MAEFESKSPMVELRPIYNRSYYAIVSGHHQMAVYRHNLMKEKYLFTTYIGGKSVLMILSFE